MDRLTKFVTPVGMPMTALNGMKHYRPCVPCRHNAKLKTDSNGKQYTEKFDFCDTCEVKMLFNRLKEYEDLEEQGLLLKLPSAVGSKVYEIIEDDLAEPHLYIAEYTVEDISAKGVKYCDDWYDFEDSSNLFSTRQEAEEKLRELEEKRDEDFERH